MEDNGSLVISGNKMVSVHSCIILFSPSPYGALIIFGTYYYSPRDYNPENVVLLLKIL